MAEGSKARRGMLKHQRRKFLKLFPEREKKSTVRMKPGVESRQVVGRRTELSGNRITKLYDIGKPAHGRPGITEEEMIARFKLQKELYSKGYPVARPIRIRIDRKNGRIVWEEELVGNGVTYKDLEEMHTAKRSAGKENPEWKRMQEEFERSVEMLDRFSREEELDANVSDAMAELIALRGRGVELDLKKENAVWDPEKKRFVFTDLYSFRRKKEKNNI